MITFAVEQTNGDSMDKPSSDSHFKIMSLNLKFRDLFLPRKNILKELDIKPGFYILDYGCGPGSYTAVAAQLVGETGKVYALDIHLLAIQKVKSMAKKKGLTNIETILSDCATGLKDESIDIVFLYDVMHGLSELDAVLKELYRVLKPSGVLSSNDHHLEEDQIISKITNAGLFRFLRKGKRTYNFSKVNP
jgi:ubiquinone/menaquinone biosynthesis C-methylase UbiE